jgi:hypothetical protein
MELLGSNLGRVTGYRKTSRGFLQSLQTNGRIVSLLGHECSLPDPFQFIDRATIPRYMDRQATDSVVQQTIRSGDTPRHIPEDATAHM